MSRRLKTIAVVMLFFLWASGSVYAYELKTRYATITYDNTKALRKFNKKLYMGKLKYQLKKNRSGTVEEDVKNKINLIVEKVESVLAMFPANLKFKIVIHPSIRGVDDDLERIYRVRRKFLAFYAPKENTVFFSANNAKLRVVAHEIGHVVAENYFAISPPQKIHEVLAQYAESHITD